MTDPDALIVVSLYKFVSLRDYEAIQASLLKFCKARGIKGTLLLAEEGINGTVSGSRVAIDALLDFFFQDPRFAGLEYKEAVATCYPFHRMKVKLKKEIVTMGVVGLDPSVRTGKRLSTKQWNRILSDPEVLVLDARNHYEYSIGSFKSAQFTGITTFREFPRYVRLSLSPERVKKVAMFCTGGIRCEKASTYMLEQGFSEVYQLDGGILRYLSEVNDEENLWQGECFVFDRRVSVDADLQAGNYDQCFACRRPIAALDKQSEYYQPGVSCPYCHDVLTDDQRLRFAERQKQVTLAGQRGQQHIGALGQLSKQE